MDWTRQLRLVLDRYWFGPGTYRDLALARIVVVGGHLLFFYPSLERQLLYATAHSDTFLALPALKVLLLPLGEWGIRPDPTLIHAVWLVGIIAGIAGVLGKYTRLSLLGHAAASTLLVAHAYSYGTLHHPQGPLIIALWALAFSRCGRAWSLDDLQERITGALARSRFQPIRGSHSRGDLARWPLLVVQWVLALAYLSAGMTKLVNGGWDWFGSSTLAYYLVQDGIRHDTLLGLTLAGYPTLLSVIAVVVVVFELTFVLAVLLPRTAWVYLLMGMGMHAGILVTQGAPFLQWSLLYVAFLPALRTTFPATYLRPRLSRWFASSGAAGQWVIVYDGYCSLCIRTMVALDYLDMRGRLISMDLEREWDRVARTAPSLTRDQARHAMHVVTPEGRLVQGFDAFRELTRAVPLLWPLVPVTHAPFVRPFGNRIYGIVAQSRARGGPCGAEGCAVGFEPSTWASHRNERDYARPAHGGKDISAVL
jgi:predicted DCC family thiol-disulfide oxidoreductase YuxK